MRRRLLAVLVGPILIMIGGCAGPPGTTDGTPTPSATSSTDAPPSPSASTDPSDGPWILEDSCGGTPPVDRTADLEEFEALNARLPAPAQIGPEWSYTVYDRGAPCLQFSMYACISSEEFDLTIDDRHRAAVDYARPGVTVFGLSVNAETDAERYVAWMAETIAACPLGQPVASPPGAGATDVVTTLTAFDEAGTLGAVSICRQYTSVWNAGTRRSDSYTCQAAEGTTRAWFSILVDPAQPLSRDEAAAAISAAASAVFAD